MSLDLTNNKLTEVPKWMRKNRNCHITMDPIVKKNMKRPSSGAVSIRYVVEEREGREERERGEKREK